MFMQIYIPMNTTTYCMNIILHIEYSIFSIIFNYINHENIFRNEQTVNIYVN